MPFGSWGMWEFAPVVNNKKSARESSVPFGSWGMWEAQRGPKRSIETMKSSVPFGSWGMWEYRAAYKTFNDVRVVSAFRQLGDVGAYTCQLYA